MGRDQRLIQLEQKSCNAQWSGLDLSCFDKVHVAST